MNDIALNEVMVDWLTLTNYQKMEGCLDIADGDLLEESRMQYSGVRKGSVFYGQALQGGFVHNLLQVSGAESDRVGMPYIVSYESAKCTRIDVQITCFCHNPDMRALYNKLAEKWKTSSFVTSSSGDTIYIGGWKSERFTRIYQKDNRRLLRVEMCWKGGYSEGARIKLLEVGVENYRKTISRWMRYELMRLDDSLLYFVFLKSLTDGEEKPVRFAVKEESDRERWLRRIVLPTLTRYANMHDSDVNLLNDFCSMLDIAIQRKIG